MRRLNVVTRLIQREPVAFQGCVQATLAALVGFGVVDWSTEQVGLMLGVVAAFLALYTRAVVSPTSTPGTQAPASAVPREDAPDAPVRVAGRVP
ncbi:hypothetical protein GCM10027176_05070 [Actinoallomurus bryophytorum]|uniref:Phage r1t holin n=1 Tax=Actinoallomurus bryophytorum TaxID=1490222 RepID=A0A543CJI5_9ACTN|nr:hypothetical protein [Actinoallomurus bryophytorum]TQL97225.1 hypothetical protein FB559_2803 [Actinoallomurus bryophytorum]